LIHTSYRQAKICKYSAKIRFLPAYS